MMIGITVPVTGVIILLLYRYNRKQLKKEG
jgi:heme/copper-type cytochrome/quinol oxidase subunit 2